MKRLFTLLLALLMLLPAAALADSDPALIAAADAQTERMLALTRTEGYIDISTASGDMAELARQTIAHDYSDPVRIAVVTLEHDAFALFNSMLNSTDFTSADPIVLDALCSKSFAALPTRINALQGAEWLAVSSILTTGDVLLLDGVDACVAYVIAEYSADAPLTCVSFYVKEGGLTLVGTQFVNVDSDIRDELFDSDALLAELQPLPDELLSAITDGATFNVYTAAACPVE